MKYKVIAYEKINHKSYKYIGFISPEGAFHIVRKCVKRKATHKLVADKILSAYNDKASDFYYSSLKLISDYGYVMVLDDYGNYKCSIHYHQIPTANQLDVINKIYPDYDMLYEDAIKPVILEKRK